jgi:hypothetical protein
MNPRSTAQAFSQAIVLVFSAIIGFLFTGSPFMLFFVPIVGYYLWSTYSRTKDLERRLDEMQKPPTPPEQPKEQQQP